MTTLVKLSIFGIIVFTIAQLPNYAPEVKSEASTAKNMPVEAIKVEPIVADSATSPQPEVKPVEGVEQWRPLVAKYFPSNQINNFLMIMKCESNGRPDAVGHNRNGSTDRGLGQVNSIHSDRVNGDLDSLLDPETNIRISAEIFHDNGDSFSPWTCSKKVHLDN